MAKSIVEDTDVEMFLVTESTENMLRFGVWQLLLLSSHIHTTDNRSLDLIVWKISKGNV